MPFEWRKPGQGDTSTTDGRMIVVRGRSLNDRIRMLFAAATIGTADEVAKTSAARIEGMCGDALCSVTHTFNLLRSLAVYDDDEGKRFRGDSDFDVFRTFKHLARSGLADCDCYTASLNTLLWLQGIQSGARAIEQWDRYDNRWVFNHVYGIVKIDGAIVPLELTPVPPNRILVGPGWETPRDTYRNKADFWYDGAAWSRWKSSVDLSSPSRLGAVFLHTAPPVHSKNS